MLENISAQLERLNSLLGQLESFRDRPFEVDDFNTALDIFFHIGQILKDNPDNDAIKQSIVSGFTKLTKVKAYTAYFDFMLHSSFISQLQSKAETTLAEDDPPTSKTAKLTALKELANTLILGLSVFFESPFRAPSEYNDSLLNDLAQTFIRDQYNLAWIQKLQDSGTTYLEHLRTEAAQYQDLVELDPASQRYKFKPNTPLAELKTELQSAQAEITRLTSEIHVKKREYAQVRSLIQDIQERYDALNHGLEILQQQSEKLPALQVQEEAELQAMEQSLAQMERDLGENTQTHATKKAAYDKILTPPQQKFREAQQAYTKYLDGFSIPLSTARTASITAGLTKASIIETLAKIREEIKAAEKNVQETAKRREEAETEQSEALGLAESELLRKQEAHPKKLKALEDHQNALQKKLNLASAYKKELEEAERAQAKADREAEARGFQRDQAAEEKAKVLAIPEETPAEETDSGFSWNGFLKKTFQVSAKAMSATLDAGAATLEAAYKAGVVTVEATSLVISGTADLVMKPDYSGLPKDKGELEALISRLTTELDTAKTAVSEWNTRYKDKRSTDKDIETATAARDTIKVNSQDLLDHIEAEEKAALELRRLQEREVELQTELLEYERKIELEDKKIKKIEEEQRQAEPKIAALRKTVEETKQAYEGTVSALSQSAAEIKTLAQQIEQLAAAIPEAQKDLETKRLHLEEIKTLITTLPNRIASISQEITDTKSALDEKQACAKTLVEEAKAQITDLHVAQKKAATIKQKYESERQAKSFVDKYNDNQALLEIAAAPRSEKSIDKKVEEIREKIPDIVKTLSTDRNPYTKVWLVVLSVVTVGIMIPYAISHWDVRGKLTGDNMQQQTKEFIPRPTTCREALPGAPVELPALCLN